MSLPPYSMIALLVDTDVPPPGHRVTRSGIRRYLMQAAAKKPVAPLSAPYWYRLWKQIEWTRRMAAALHVTIPAKLWTEDRARLAAKLTTSMTETTYTEERERALRWTRRRAR